MKLIIWKYWSVYMKLYIEKRPEFWLNDWILHHDNATAHKALLVRSSGFWPKNQLLKWNTHPVPLIWLWMIYAVSRNKVWIKGMKISVCQKHSKKCDDSTESYSTTGKVKVKLSLCLTKYHAMKAYWGSGGIAPLIIWPWH
jgi:hypothetical protein